MSERAYYDEESLKEYRADLIRQRNELDPVTNQFQIKILDDMIENLPKKYPTNDTPDEENIVEEPKLSFKERIVNSLGVFGTVLLLLIRLIVSILPFVMIGGNFFVTLLLISINAFVPVASAVFWIWGLVCAIQGVQDIWAIIYYIAFVVIWIPFYISLIVSTFSKK